MKKRVACLYRVSTKKQTKEEDEIPMQRDACNEFIKRKDDWKLCKEYIEPGVSGYHKGIGERPVLQEVLNDAVAQEFDILLVFMFDRLGRKSLETTTIAKKLSDCGIELWSVCEGPMKFDNAMDVTVNVLRFSGANTESAKTATRVDSARNYATKQGKFSGGVVPYGYCLQQTGTLDKKGRMINDFVKNPSESVIVEEIYSKLIDENMTLNGIITYLNVDRQLRTRGGKKWCTTTVRNILRNPIYKGYMSYGKTRMFKVQEKDKEGNVILTDSIKRQRGVSADNWILAEKQNPEYAIVSEERWQIAQDILIRRNKRYNDSLRVNKDNAWKSTLLLSGLLECGYCHGRISPAVSSQKKILKDGSESRCYTDYYKCNTRARGNKLCDARSYISQRKLEDAVLTEVNNFLDRVETVNCTEEIIELSKGISATEVRELSNIKAELVKLEKGIAGLQDELLKFMIGESKFSDTHINQALNSAEIKKVALERQVREIEQKMQARKVEQEQFEATVQMIPVWREVFANAPLNVKKHLLSVLIEKIVVTNDNIDIHFKMDINRFLQAGKESTKKDAGSEDFVFMKKPVIETAVHVANYK